MNLTWKLVGVLDGTLPESVLDTYEQERKLHAAAMILMAVSVGAAMTGGGRVGDLIRHVVFPRMQNLRLPGTAGQCRRRRRPRSAQFRTGDQIPHTRRAGWNAVP